MSRSRSMCAAAMGLGLSLLAAGLAPPEASAARLTQVTAFGSNPGALKMYLYAPDNMPDNAPVIVAMHGCVQSATAYAQGGWMALADALKFYVIYPEQTSSNNPAQCFNWAGEYGDPANMIRGQGENQSIIDMIDYVKGRYSVNEERVFATGFSAGGAMAAVMLATWPDVFAAGAINAGVPYYCADSVNGAYRCMSPGVNKTPAQWGDLVRSKGFPRDYDGPIPRVSIWHGSADSTVVPLNMTELVDQWTNVNGVDANADISENITTAKGVHAYKGYTDAQGVVRVESYEIAGMGHGVALDPGLSEAAGCGTAGAYFYDEDICSTYRQAVFFGLDNQDTTPPVVAITSPRDGASVQGSVAVAVSASDAEGVDGVTLFVDGQSLGVDRTPPYAFTWDASEEANGIHVLTAQATDGSGNVGEDLVEVEVTGGVVDETPPTVRITSPSDGDTVGGAVTLTAQANDDFGVAAVTFFVDGSAIGSDSTPPYEIAWDAAGSGEGRHTLGATAEDAAGNSADAPSVTVTVDSAVNDFEETFSSFPTDNGGWTLGGWRPNRADHTGGRSRSLKGAAEASFGTTAATASITVQLGSAPTLSYWRQIDVYTANTLASARFAVTVNGEAVDEETYSGFGDDGEFSWTRRQGIDLSRYAGQTVELGFTVEATDTGSILTSAEALIDDITLTMGR